ncbi:MAG TPA: hypothetical protein VFC78_14580 [Tepidisphaeraceae bacterium]|nr:hypothetical protein [Tepidisphaeraceae bacterium]
MYRRAAQSTFLVLLLGALSGGVYLFHAHNSTEQSLRRDLKAEQQRSEQLKRVVQRLTTERRVADIVVTSQSESAGILYTGLLFREYARDGSQLPDKRFTIEGKLAHIDAMVIKFDGKFVEDNDPLRGHSIALFTRLYGEKQSPADAFAIDEPGKVPEIYRGAGEQVTQFEQGLWANFWKLADDPAYRKSMGVRVAQGEGVWRGFEPGWLYTLTLESNGGVNITPEKIKGIFQEAMKQRPATTHADHPTTQAK